MKQTANIDSAQEANRRLRLLQDVRKSIDTTMNLDELLPKILDLGLEAMGVNTGSIMLLNVDFEHEDPQYRNRGGVLEFLARREGRQALTKDQKLTVFGQGEGVAGWVALHGKPLLVADVTKTKRFRWPKFGPPLFRSLLSVPIIPSDRAIGVINRTTRTPASLPIPTCGCSPTSQTKCS